MEMQNFEKKNREIQNSFFNLKKENPEKLKKKLKLSWSNWGFGMEKLSDSAERLASAGIKYMELHGNHYGPDLGYEAQDVMKILGDCGIKVAGICGIFSADNDLSSNRGIHRQAAIDYLRRELEFASEVNASYINECFVTPEPLGAIANPYVAMYGNPDKINLDEMVIKTVTYFRKREEYVRELQ